MVCLCNILLLSKKKKIHRGKINIQKCVLSSVIREKQTEITVQYNHTPTTVAKVIELDQTTC